MPGGMGQDHQAVQHSHKGRDLNLGDNRGTGFINSSVLAQEAVGNYKGRARLNITKSFVLGQGEMVKGILAPAAVDNRGVKNKGLGGAFFYSRADYLN